nr:hypothetical protein [Nocardiopsis mwathae]
MTITTTRRPATDLGYLLHEHPDRVQCFAQSFGTAHVFYPEAGADRCTAALMLEVDPQEPLRARTTVRSPDFALARYVDDRPYAAASLFAVALGDTFRSALKGRCPARPDLAVTALPLTLSLPAVPCRGGAARARSLFEPLGWQVDAVPVPLDPGLPGWGDSRYVGLTLTGEMRLADALSHLYVLLPAMDGAEHYRVAEDEIDKLARAGEGWLSGHPERAWITRRYLSRRQRLFSAAIARLDEVDDLPGSDAGADPDEPADPAAPVAEPGEPPREDRAPSLADRAVSGGGVETAHGRVRIGPENALAALEVMSRFAVDPRWLLYLPPTMAPAPTAADPELLEHPAEAFAHYRSAGVDAGTVICQEKHMGSRAVAVVCRDAAAAERRFVPDSLGAIHTRTGRPFFTDPKVESEVLAELRAGITAAGLWERLDTDWVALDGEMLPWSAKAEGLIRERYAAVGAAARAALPAAGAALAAAAGRGLEVGELADRVSRRADGIEAFSRVYRRYSWPTEGAAGLRYAPFAVLTAEGRAFTDADHLWHMAVAERLADACDLVRSTRYLVVDVTDPDATAAAAAWWRELVDAGGEGMVVKPLTGALARGRQGLAQPGLKVRGPEYLRIIYGPDYTEPERMRVLRERRPDRKSGLAMREHKLGLEALARHARGEPLWRVHQAVFGVLALESEPVDPRL